MGPLQYLFGENNSLAPNVNTNNTKKLHFPSKYHT